MTELTETARLDVLAIGRVGVDIYPLQDGVGLEDVSTFGKYLGGSATNVAVAAAKHGLRSAIITRTGDDPSTASREVGAALPHVTVAVGNREECEIAVGESDPQRAADALLDRGVELAIVKQGPRGVLARTATESVEVPTHFVDVVNGLAAGDSFGGALCFGLLQEWPLETILRFANVAGAIVAGRRECSTAMPTTEEVNEVLTMGAHV
jgi:sugar/nucleoside kinase (ribokinase family)